MARLVSVGGVVGVALIAVVSWLAAVAHAGPEQLPTVRYAYFKAYDPVFVGIEKGFFRKAGVNVELTGSFPSGPASVQASAAGQVDAGLCAVTGLILARNGGVEVRGIADSQTEFRKAPLQRFYVKPESSIRSVRDLRGKKIAVNSKAGSFYFAMLTALSKNGLSANDVQWVIVPIPQQQQALAQGQVDVIGLIDPWNKMAEASGDVRKLFNAVDYMGERHVSLIFFTLDYLAKNEEAVKRFVKGYRAAIKWATQTSSANRRAANGIMWKYIGSESRYQAKHMYTPGAGVHMADVQYWLDFMRKEGALNDGGRLRPANVASIRYAGKG